MKTNSILFSVLMIIILSCDRNKDVTITGNISNYDKTVLLLVNNRVPDLADTLIIKDGKFFKTLTINNPGFRVIKYGDYSRELFLMPGFALKISFDAMNIEDSFTIEGKGSAENAVIDSLYKEVYRMDLDIINNQAAEVVIAYLDSMQAANRKYLAALIGSATVDPQLREYASASLDYDYAIMRNFREDVSKLTDLKSNGSRDKLYVENEKYLDISGYRTFLIQTDNNMVTNDFVKGDKSIWKSPHKVMDAELSIIEKFKNTRIREYLIYEAVSRYLNDNGFRYFDTYYDYFKKNNTDSMYARQLEKEYLKKFPISPGQPAPEFIAEDINGKMYTLDDFKGRNIYIDVWATWCFGCLVEGPHFIKIQHEYIGKNIAFISISFDEERDRWEKYLKENKQEGLSLIAHSGFDSDLAKGFQIEFIPTFILIGKDGKIVDANAPQPSSPDIQKTLDELLARE